MPELTIELSFHGVEDIPASVVTWAVAEVNAALRELAREDLLELRGEFREIPPEALQRAAQELDSADYNALLITDVRKGSLVFFAAVAGVTIWILERTVGESLTEAWKKSRMHESIVAFLSKRGPQRRRSARSKIDERLSRTPDRMVERPKVEVREIDGANGGPRIGVRVTIDPQDRFAPREPGATEPPDGSSYDEIKSRMAQASEVERRARGSEGRDVRRPEPPLTA